MAETPMMSWFESRVAAVILDGITDRDALFDTMQERRAEAKR